MHESIWHSQNVYAICRAFRNNTQPRSISWQLQSSPESKEAWKPDWDEMVINSNMRWVERCRRLDFTSHQNPTPCLSNQKQSCLSLGKIIWYEICWIAIRLTIWDRWTWRHGCRYGCRYVPPTQIKQSINHLNWSELGTMSCWIEPSAMGPISAIFHSHTGLPGP